MPLVLGALWLGGAAWKSVKSEKTETPPQEAAPKQPGATDVTEAPVRLSVPSRFSGIPQLAFSIEAPAGFEAPGVPEEKPRFEDPKFMMPLWLAGSPVALAIVAVSARPAYDDGSVEDWLRFLGGEQGLTFTTLGPGKLGPHPAIVADATQVQEQTPLRMRIAAFEDGGMLYIVMTMAPEALWPSYGAGLENAVASFRLDRPIGSSRPLTRAG